MSSGAEAAVVEGSTRRYALDLRAIAIAIGATLAFAGAAFGADIGSLAWDQANVATLRSFDKAAVATFLNEQQRKERLPPGIPFQAITARDIVGFGWADPAGNGHYQLLVASSGPCAHAVTIYNRDASGRVATAQVLGFRRLEIGDKGPQRRRQRRADPVEIYGRI